MSHVLLALSFGHATNIVLVWYIHMYVISVLGCQKKVLHNPSTSKDEQVKIATVIDFYYDEQVDIIVHHANANQ